MSSQKLLKKNLSYFAADFRKRIFSLASNLSHRITVEEAKTGDFIPRYNGKFLHSKYNPYKDAQTFCQKYAHLDCEVIVVFGFGFGYHVEELRRLNPNTEIIIYELLPDILCAAFQYRDFSALFEKGRITLTAEKYISDFATAFAKTDRKVIQEKKCQIVIHPQAVEVAPPEFGKLINALEILEMGRKQPRIFNKLESDNLYKNAEIISQSLGIAKLRNKYENLPALVVGAGPSLDNTLPYLYQHKGKFLILAVDAAITALMNEGIQPDFLVTIDPQKAVFNHLANHLEMTTPIFATPIAYHRLLSEYRGDKIFISQDNSPFCDEITALQDLGTTKAGSSVSCFTIDIALQLGCKEIFLTGIDSSFSCMMAYAKKAKIAINNEEYILKKKLIETDDIFGGQVMTHQNLYEYLRTIELQIETSVAEFFLIGALGARIKGAKSLHQRHIQAFTGSELLKNKLFALNAFQTKEKNESLLQEIQHSASYTV